MSQSSSSSSSSSMDVGLINQNPPSHKREEDDDERKGDVENISSDSADVSEEEVSSEEEVPQRRTRRVVVSPQVERNSPPTPEYIYSKVEVDDKDIILPSSTRIIHDSIWGPELFKWMTYYKIIVAARSDILTRIDSLGRPRGELRKEDLRKLLAYDNVLKTESRRVVQKINPGDYRFADQREMDNWYYRKSHDDFTPDYQLARKEARNDFTSLTYESVPSNRGLYRDRLNSDEEKLLQRRVEVKDNNMIREGADYEQSPDSLLAPISYPHNFLIKIILSILCIILGMIGVIIFSVYSTVVMVCTASIMGALHWIWSSWKIIKKYFRDKFVGTVTEVTEDVVSAVMSGAYLAVKKTFITTEKVKRVVVNTATRVSDKTQELVTSAANTTRDVAQKTKDKAIVIGGYVIGYKYYIMALSVAVIAARVLTREKLPDFQKIRWKFFSTDKKILESAFSEYVESGYRGPYLGSTRNVLDAVLAIMLAPFIVTDGFTSVCRFASEVRTGISFIINGVQGLSLIANVFGAESASEAIDDMNTKLEDTSKRMQDRINASSLKKIRNNANDALDIYESELDSLAGVDTPEARARRIWLTKKIESEECRLEKMEDRMTEAGIHPDDVNTLWSLAKRNPKKFWVVIGLIAALASAVVYMQLKKKKKKYWNLRRMKIGLILFTKQKMGLLKSGVQMLY